MTGHLQTGTYTSEDDRRFPLNVLHVVPSLSLESGGLPVAVTELCVALQSSGAMVTIATTDLLSQPQATNLRTGVQLNDMPMGANRLDINVFPTNPPLRLATSFSLLRYLLTSTATFDLVHIHHMFLFPQFAAWMAANRQQVPHVVSVHGALDPYLRQRGRARKKIMDLIWQRRMLDTASALHLTSKEEMTQLESFRIRAEHVVIPNGISMGKFRYQGKPTEFRHKYLGGYDGALIVTHGRLAAKKGLDILIDATAQLPGVQLAIIGPDAEGIGVQLTSQANSLGCGDRIHLITQLRDEELRDAIRAADVWALPSHGENFGIAVVEAMALGLAVVTSSNVNIASDAADAHALKMVPNTADDFREAIADLLKNPSTSAEMAQRAHEYASRFDWSVIGAQYVSMYENAITKFHLKRPK